DNFNAVATANNDNQTQITSLQNKAAATWLPLTLTNGTPYSPPTFTAPAYYIDALGWVHVKGLVGGLTGGQVIATLPAGYRPSERYLLGCRAASPTGGEIPGRIDVFPTGDITIVTPASGSLTYVSMDQVYFKAM